MRTLHVYFLVIATVFSCTIWSCAQSKSEPAAQNMDSIANAQAEQNRRLAASTADSVAKVAEASKLALEDKVEEVEESIKKAYPYAYDLKPVDKEPTTDMTSLKDAIVYPKEAKDRNIEGRVYVRALVGTNGRIIKSFTEHSTNTMFDEPSRTAVKRAKFTPAMNNGKRIQRWVSVPVIYRLI
jgi:TonB family protein